MKNTFIERGSGRIRKDRGSGRIFLSSLLCLSSLSFTAFAPPVFANESTDLHTCYVTQLTAHGARRSHARRVANTLVNLKDKNYNPNVIGILARRQAERVSSDEDWISWAQWVAQNAYNNC